MSDHQRKSQVWPNTILGAIIIMVVLYFAFEAALPGYLDQVLGVRPALKTPEFHWRGVSALDWRYVACRRERHSAPSHLGVAVGECDGGHGNRLPLYSRPE
jgi:hypothetical protein